MQTSQDGVGVTELQVFAMCIYCIQGYTNGQLALIKIGDITRQIYQLLMPSKNMKQAGDIFVQSKIEKVSDKFNLQFAALKMKKRIDSKSILKIVNTIAEFGLFDLVLCLMAVAIIFGNIQNLKSV